MSMDANEAIVAKIVVRLTRLFFTKQGALKKAPVVVNAAGNVLFLVSTLPFANWKDSDTLSKPLLTFLQFFWQNVHVRADIRDSMIIACHRLNWYPPGYEDLSQNRVASVYGRPKSRGYEAITNLYCGQYLNDAASDPVKTSSKAGQMMLQGFNLCLESIDRDLEFTGNATAFVKQDDDNLHRVYFVTHVVFVLTSYGAVSTDICVPKKDREKFVRVLQRWYNQITERKATWPNLELFLEICICLVYFGESIADKVLYDELLKLGSEHHFHLAKLGVKSTENVFFPPINARSPEFLTDYHSHILVAMFLLQNIE